MDKDIRGGRLPVNLEVELIGADGLGEIKKDESRSSDFHSLNLMMNCSNQAIISPSTCSCSADMSTTFSAFGPGPLNPSTNC